MRVMRKRLGKKSNGKGATSSRTAFGSPKMRLQPLRAARFTEARGTAMKPSGDGWRLPLISRVADAKAGFELLAVAAAQAYVSAIFQQDFEFSVFAKL